LLIKKTYEPFSDLGISPDIIMNPHGLPSRMTIGKLIELVTGKLSAYKGYFSDSSAFTNEYPTMHCKDLINYGFSYTGKDYLTSGVSGKSLETYVFMGPIYYQQLKHMVADKIHVRGHRGPKDSLTRQPPSGRSKQGGLRLGEMERDCLIGHGASMTMYERFMVASDKYISYICKKCGFIGQKNWCQYCRCLDNLYEIEIPYCCKLLFQELLSMHILPKIKIKNIINPL